MKHTPEALAYVVGPTRRNQHRRDENLPTPRHKTFQVTPISVQYDNTGIWTNWDRYNFESWSSRTSNVGMHRTSAVSSEGGRDVAFMCLLKGVEYHGLQGYLSSITHGCVHPYNRRCTISDNPGRLLLVLADEYRQERKAKPCILILWRYFSMCLEALKANGWTNILSPKPLTYKVSVKTCLVYQDDMIMLSNNVRDNMKYVDRILTTLEDPGVKMKINKCKCF